MNINVFAGSAYGPTLPVGWILAGMADFNGDGNLDYALFNPGTRQTAIWDLSGVTLIGGVYGPTLPNNWRWLVSPISTVMARPIMCFTMRAHVKPRFGI